MRVCRRHHESSSSFVLVVSLLIALLGKTLEALPAPGQNDNNNNNTSNNTNPNERKTVAILKVFTGEASQRVDVLTSEIVARERSGNETTTTTTLIEKIVGKLIYAKTYDQILLDQILNKSDTYYKKCSCIPIVGSATSSKVVALLEQSDECNNENDNGEFAQCARELNASALLIPSLDQEIQPSSTTKSQMLPGKRFDFK